MAPSNLMSIDPLTATFPDTGRDMLNHDSDRDWKPSQKLSGILAPDPSLWYSVLIDLYTKLKLEFPMIALEGKPEWISVSFSHNSLESQELQIKISRYQFQDTYLAFNVHHRCSASSTGCNFFPLFILAFTWRLMASLIFSAFPSLGFTETSDTSKRVAPETWKKDT